MLQIGSAIVSLDIIEKKFACNLAKCKGMCCVYGDSGAPLYDDEIDILKEAYTKVKPYMTREGIEVVERMGVYATDFDNEKVTPLIGDSEECAFSFCEKGVHYCAIEKAFINGETDFRKPVSCHLYPVRITRFTDFEAVNYHQWRICEDANEYGKKKETPIFVFLKEPLIRKFGADWYGKLCRAATKLKSDR